MILEKTLIFSVGMVLTHSEWARLILRETTWGEQPINIRLGINSQYYATKSITSQWVGDILKLGILTFGPTDQNKTQGPKLRATYFSGRIKRYTTKVGLCS